MNPNYTLNLDTIDETVSIDLTNADRSPKKLAYKSVWYLGSNIPNVIHNTDFSDFEWIEISSTERLLSMLKGLSIARKAEPEALLIEDSFLSILNAEEFSNFHTKRIPILVLLSKEGKDLIRNGVSFPGVDGCFSPGTSFEHLLFKINFCRKMKESERKPYPRMENKTEKSQFTWKRAFDIVAAGSALLILSPLLVLIAILVRLESKGSIFYVSKRAGKNYQIFNFYKFRTMEVNADKKLADLSSLNQYGNEDDQKVFFKIKNDPRVTKVGKFLRNTSLDELPQLVNILKGNMSIVGNRPLPLYEAEALTADNSAERFLAPSGLTGLWQVRKRGTDHMTIEERITLDRIYARKRSMKLDLKLMFQTLAVFVQKESV